MKPSGRKKDVLLSRNNAKALFVRNAHDTVLLKKEERILQREWNSEDKTYQKKREHLLQRRLHMAEELSATKSSEKTNDSHKNRHPTISTSLSLPVIKVTQSKASCSFDDFQPSRRRSASATPATNQLSPYENEHNPRRHSVPGMTNNLRSSISLPDVNAYSSNLIENKLPRGSLKSLEKSFRAKSCQEICAEERIDEWKDLKKCRYLRTPSSKCGHRPKKEHSMDKSAVLYAFGDWMSGKVWYICVWECAQL